MPVCESKSIGAGWKLLSKGTEYSLWLVLWNSSSANKFISIYPNFPFRADGSA
jgi:hypothetical protein